MQYNFDNMPDRRNTESVKWGIYDADVLPMWVADMDFVSPEPVVQALIERVEHRVFGYPLVNSQLKDAVVERMGRLYQWQISAEDVVFIPGVVVGFNIACHAAGAPGEGILMQTPVYPPFLSAPQNAGLERQAVELKPDAQGYYAVDFDEFEAAITPNTRMFLLCNPHNPIGRVFSRQELERMSEICLKHGVIVCSDEIHCDLVFSGHQHIPMASLSPEVAQNTITLVAPSKTYNIAGLDCSVAIVQNKELRDKLYRATEGLVGSVNLLGLTAALAAYRDGQEWLTQMLSYVEKNRDFLHRYVQQNLPGVTMYKPEGTYLAWLDFRKTNIEGNPYEFFLKQARVALNNGADFGQGGEGFARLNFGCPHSMLEESLERMKKAFERK